MSRHNPKSLLRQLYRTESLRSHVDSGCSTAECCELEMWENVLGISRTVQECAQWNLQDLYCSPNVLRGI